MNASTLVQKLRNHCNVLRDDGMKRLTLKTRPQEAALEQFRLIAADLGDEAAVPLNPA
jgi:hypothetical protein